MINYNQSPAQEELASPTLPTVDQAQKLKDMGMLNDETFGKVMQKIDPNFLKSVIQVESAGRADAVSPKGAQGLMQVMPATAKEVAGQLGMMNYNINKPEDNIAIGSKYLSDQIDKYGNKELALAAYNAGPGAVDRAIQKAGSNDPSAVLPFLPKETQNYVPKVMTGYQGQAAQAPSESQYSAPNLQGVDVGDIRNNAAPSAKILDVVSSVPSPYGANQSSATMKSEAIDNISNIGIQRAQEEADYMREASRQQDLMFQERQRKEIEKQDIFNQQKMRYEQAREEAANAKIDPNRFWSQKGTGEKVVAGIAVALGAIGQGLTKSNNNSALDIITSQIDRDIEAQKSEILAKRDKAAAEGNMLQELRIKLGDDRAAESALRVMYLDNVEMKTKEFAARSKSKEVAANRDLLLAEIQAESEKRQAEVLKTLAENSIAERKLGLEEKKVAYENPGNRRQLMQGVISGVQTDKGVQKLSPEDLPEKDRVRYVPGLGLAITADDAKKLKDSQTSFKKFDNILEEMINSRKEYGSYGPIDWATDGGSEVKKQKARATEALLSIKDMENLGTLDAGAIKVGGRILPENPAEIRFSGDPVAELQEVRRRARLNFSEKIKSSLSIVSPEAEQQILGTEKIIETPISAKGTNGRTN